MIERRKRCGYLDNIDPRTQRPCARCRRSSRVLRSSTPSSASRVANSLCRGVCTPRFVLGGDGTFAGGPLLSAAACIFSGVCLLRIRYQSGRGARRTFGRLLVAMFVGGSRSPMCLSFFDSKERRRRGLRPRTAFVLGVTMRYTSTTVHRDTQRASDTRVCRR